MTVALDKLDRKILVELQRDCTISAQRLAERCGTTESTALRRWKRLVKVGVIKKQVAVLEAAAVGVPLMMVVLIRITRESVVNTVPTMRRIADHANVLQLFHVTGSTDYVAVIAAASMADYENFITAVLDVDPNVATDTNVVIRPIKLSLELPLDA